MFQTISLENRQELMQANLFISSLRITSSVKGPLHTGRILFTQLYQTDTSATTGSNNYAFKFMYLVLRCSLLLLLLRLLHLLW